MNAARSSYESEVTHEIIRAGSGKEMAKKLVNIHRKLIDDARRARVHPRAIGGAIFRGTFLEPKEVRAAVSRHDGNRK